MSRILFFSIYTLLVSFLFGENECSKAGMLNLHQVVKATKGKERAETVNVIINSDSF